MPSFSSRSPSLSINGINCAIFVGEQGDQGGIIEQWTDRGLEIRIEFIVKWSDRIRFIQTLRGSAAVDESGNIVRIDPWTLPANPNDPLPDFPVFSDHPYYWNYYLCIGTDPFRPIKPKVDQDGSETGLEGWLYYDYVLIPARFAIPPYRIGAFTGIYEIGTDLSGYPYTSVKGKASGEVFQCWNNSYKFENINQPAGDVGLIRSRQEFTITRYMMPFLDTEKYDALIGKVNDEEIKIGTTTYKRESMLYMGYEPEWIGDPSTGLLFCNVHHSIMANGVMRTTDGIENSSWNWALTKNGAFDKMVSRDNGTPPYTSSEFIPVLWPETQ